MSRKNNSGSGNTDRGNLGGHGLLSREGLSGALRTRQGLWEGLVVFFAITLYLRTVGFGWVYDDQMEIVLNPFVRSLKNLPRIFSSTVWAGSGMETYLYRPLALASYAANHLVSGLAPWSYHLVNVALFAGVALMVVRVGRRWGLSVLAAGLGGLLFAIHPIHVEVVAPAFGRKDLLAAFFVLLMVLAHPIAVDRGGWRTAVPVLAFLGAVLSKEVGVVGLVLVAGQDWFLVKDRKTLFADARRANLFVAYVATLLAYILVRNLVTGGVGVPDTFYMDNPLVQAPILVRLATAVAVVGKGLALQLLPLSQSPDYSFNAIPLVQSPMDLRFLGSMAFLLLLAGSLMANRGRKPILFLASLWYVVALLPTANLLILVGTIFGERLLFIPSVAFCLASGAGIAWILQKSGWVLVPLGAWLLFLSLQTIRYSGAWDNDISLFRAAVAAVPNSTKANHKLGEELLRAGEPGQALPYLRKALRIAPDNEFAAMTLGQARQEVARRYLPNEAGEPAPRPLPEDPDILYTLGDLSLNRGDTAAAVVYWERALALNPGHTPTLMEMAMLALSQGDTVQGKERLQAAVREDPGLAEAWYTLGRVQMALGDHSAARQALERFVDEARGRFPRQVAWAREALAHLP